MFSHLCGIFPSGNRFPRPLWIPSPAPYCRNFPASKGFLIILPAKYFSKTFQEMSEKYATGFEEMASNYRPTFSEICD